MSRQPQSYVRYGSFILFKKLEESTLAEIWRAAPVEGRSVGSAVGLLRFTGGDTGALRRSAEQAAKSLGTLEGSTVVKGQTYHLVGKNPIITWEYNGGRSLFHMMQVARGGPELPANPFPVDQALAIAEKLALSLETTGHLKHGGHRLHHGVLIPQLVWVSEDGEVRTLGHQLTKGLLAALSRAPVQKQFGGFVAPELRRNGESTDPSEVWAVGANLYAMLTGEFLAPPTDQSTMDATLAEAILATDDPMPEPVRELLGRSLAIDPARRYESPAAMREAISSLTHGGEYAPTTFNLAFYIHNLLREEIEAEPADREAEKGVDPSLVPTLGAQEEELGEATGPMGVAAPVEAPAPPAAGVPAEEPRRKSKIPLIAAIMVVLLLAGGAAAYWFTIGPGARSASQETVADAGTSAANDVAAPVRRPAPVVEPLVALDTGEAGTGLETEEGATEQELRQKMIQEQIDRRLQEEILKLQAEYDRKLREERQKQQGREEPRPTQPSAPAPVQQTSTQQQPASTPSAAEELDRQQLESREPTTTAQNAQPPAQPAVTSTAQPVLPPATTTTTAATPPAPPRVNEGDLIDFAELDKAPTLTRRVEPQYPPLAARQKAEATIIVSALVSETGQVIDTRILKGDRRRLGFDEAATSAIRKSTFSPAMKDGKRVKTWMPVPVLFKSG